MTSGCLCERCGAYTHGSYGSTEHEAVLCEDCAYAGEPAGNPYDDEGELAYSDVACGEEGGVRSDPAHDNPRYPPRRS